MRVFSLALVACLAMGGQAAIAAPIYFEGFEDDSWVPGSPGWVNVERVASGNAGITSSSGNHHAVLSQGGSKYTQFGGYSSVFGTGFSTSLDVYLDTSWSTGSGFDYTVAASNQGGGHLRDFIVHIGVVNGTLLFNASNNTDATFNAFKLTNENSGNNYAIAASGWYTLQHVFYDNAGALAVDINLLSGNSVLHSITRTNAADDIATIVGGNRYGWFTYSNVSGLAIDNTFLNQSTVATVPAPGMLTLLSIGLAGIVGLRSRRRKHLQA